MQQLRLYFPLLTSRQLITGVNTAYSQEINKLRKFGLDYITPHIVNKQYKSYPFEITFIFYTSDETDAISILTTTSYIIHLFENNATLQSTDYRILPKINIQIQKIRKYSDEGCLIQIEHYFKPKK